MKQNRHVDQILALHAAGKSRKEIQEILGCTKSTLCYHLSQGQKQKNFERCQKYRQVRHPFVKKLERFLNRNHDPQSIPVGQMTNIRRRIYEKIKNFVRDKETKTMTTQPFTVEDVITKHSSSPVCYLTGQPIDIYKPSTYAFDHIIPISRGGSNSIENLGICTRRANAAKTDMTPDELYEFCRQVIAHKELTR